MPQAGIPALQGREDVDLYNYVDGREALEALLVEAVMAEASQPAPPSPDWREDLRRLAEAYWRAIRAYPQVLPLILTRRVVDPPTLASSEAILDALARGGRSGAELLAAFRAVTGFVVGSVRVELAGPLSRAEGETADDALERARALPADRFPRLLEIASAAGESDPVAEFRAGLEILLAGLGSARSPAGAPRGREPVV